MYIDFGTYHVVIGIFITFVGLYIIYDLIRKRHKKFKKN